MQGEGSLIYGPSQTEDSATEERHFKINREHISTISLIVSEMIPRSRGRGANMLLDGCITSVHFRRPAIRNTPEVAFGNIYARPVTVYYHGLSKDFYLRVWLTTHRIWEGHQWTSHHQHSNNGINGDYQIV